MILCRGPIITPDLLCSSLVQLLRMLKIEGCKYGRSEKKRYKSNAMSRHRNYCFTWNNYPADYATVLDALPARFIVAGEEHAPETGTPHLQGYICFSAAKTVSAARRALAGCHVLRANGTHAQNNAYCRKTRPEDPVPNANVYERGDPPADPADRGAAEQDRWQAAWDSAIAGDLGSIPADIRIRQYNTLLKIGRDYMPPVDRLAGPCGMWVHGDAGSGKTRSVLDAYPEAYPKPRTRWWDGYQGEPVVYIDDVDNFDVRLGGSLKLWADAYPFIAENKGSSVKIRPTMLIVTSQYTIEEIWADEQTRSALLRRFVVKEKILGEEINFI